MLVVGLATGCVTWLVAFWALGGFDRAKETGAMELDFYGGPLDGERRRVRAGLEEYPVTAPVAQLSPWGREDLTELFDPPQYGVRVVGRYVRTPQGMAWRAE